MVIVMGYAFHKQHTSPDMDAITSITASPESPMRTRAQMPLTEEKQTSTPESVSDEIMQSQPVTTWRNEFINYLESRTIEHMDFEHAREGIQIAIVANTIFFFDTVVLVLLTLFGTSYVYSKPFFNGWMLVSFI
ncbi:hypothetical protein PMG11_02803 [Penicillium brasilianum]|uniref:Uncharacterized protein n=1 Tax=Penicillium brasilianum TaxID=104259 RepID=A0A0F7TL41_PENBI|nr:hypothetical protein PMG11_02803 [Penicillium brasilianum]